MSIISAFFYLTEHLVLHFKCGGVLCVQFSVLEAFP